MTLLCAYGIGPRALRRILLIALAIAILVLAMCSPALAGEVDVESTDTTALARRAIADGELDSARRMLNRVAESDRPDDERAAAAEMRAVVDWWVASRRVVVQLAGVAAKADPSEADRLAEGGASAAGGDSWEVRFAIGRAHLLEGRFAQAANELTGVLEGAATSSDFTRARALARLSRELGERGLVLGAALGAAAANESEPVPVRGRRPLTTSRWYGWQTLIADGGSLLLIPVLGAQVGGDSGVAIATLGSYLLAAPIIHLAHGNVLNAFGSLGLRAGLPLAGAALGASVDCGQREFCGVGALVGLGLGVVAAGVIDVAVLSYDRVSAKSADDEAATQQRASRKRIAITPFGGPRRDGGFDAGLTGTF